MIERTASDPYDTMLESLEVGQQAASVLVRGPGGEIGWYTATGTLPQPVDDMSALATAFVAIKRARLAAEFEGLHPVDSRHDL